jgi:hypothetical protein
MSPEMNFEGNKILISPTNSKETTHIIWTNIEIARSCQTWQISFTCNELSRECQRGCPRLRLPFWVRISSIKGWIFLPSKMERCSKDSSCFGLPTQNNEYSRCSSFWNFSFIQLFDFSTLKIKPFHFSTFLTFRNSKWNLSTFQLFVLRLFESMFLTYFSTETMHHLFPTQDSEDLCFKLNNRTIKMIKMTQNPNYFSENEK